ncbi:hypothetical protein ACJ72_05727 [Emergomyces africanus]|uniref:Uncharacterized protein n=1 Tax=Emergomyces africanus TaxID=1955775 RepID=A0A1B7NTJ4_9EURO|nr:hypothetical protein ACJ72_05727 [Emergomyces africanus]
MPCVVSLEPSRKRQEPNDDLEQPQHQSKRLKLGGPPPAYWDNLSRIWLTKDALREFDRRNSPSNRIVESGQRPCRPLTSALPSCSLLLFTSSVVVFILLFTASPEHCGFMHSVLSAYYSTRLPIYTGIALNCRSLEYLVRWGSNGNWSGTNNKY